MIKFVLTLGISVFLWYWLGSNDFEEFLFILFATFGISYGLIRFDPDDRS